MKKTIYLSLFALVASLSAEAQIRVYNPNTGKDMKIETLVDHGVLSIPKNESHSLDSSGKSKDKQYDPNDESRYVQVYQTRAEKREAAQKKLMSMMNEVPDSKKPVEKRSIENMGTIVGFIEMKSFDKSMVKVMNSIGEMSDVNSVFYMKQFKSMASLSSFAVKVGDGLKERFKVDSNNKNARRMHVGSYPVLIYIAPDKSMARYSFSSGGLTALKIKIGEVKAILEMQEKEKREAGASSVNK